MLADRERKTSGPPREAERIIRAWRRRIDLPQEGLAQALSVTFSTVSRWENGHVKPSKRLEGAGAARCRAREVSRHRRRAPRSERRILTRPRPAAGRRVGH